MSLPLSAREPFPHAAGKRTGAALADRLEYGACFAILALMSNGLLAPLFAPDQMPDNVPWLRAMWLPVYGVIAILMLRRPLLVTRVAVPAVMSLVVVGWAMASYKWSIAPDVTMRRGIALLFTTLFGLHLAARYGWRQLIEMIAGVWFVLALASYAAVLAYPKLGVHPNVHPGAWRGIWYEKNQLGGLMGSGTLACASAAIMAPERRRLWITGAVLCAVLVVKSTSATSLMGLAACYGLLTVLALLRRGGAWPVATVWIVLAGGGALTALITLAPDVFFHLIHKDPTLTGRTGIWEALFRRVAVHPFVGYGFGAFWLDKWGPSWFIRQEVDWPAPNSHNAWLDVLAQLGLVGVGLCAAHYLASAAAALARLRKGPEAYWAIVSMALFLLFSFAESTTVLQYNGIAWVSYIATMAKLFEWQGLTAAPVPKPPMRLFPEDDPLVGQTGHGVG